MQATSLLEVDAVEYPVHFEGFHQPLHVWLRDGRHAALRPWTCGEHLAALGRHLKPGASGVTLDTAGFSDEVLAREGLRGPDAEELLPLALWWAAGGGVARARPGPEGWWELGPCRVLLRPWTAGERLKALARCVRGQGEGRAFDAGLYLEALLEASVKAVEPVGMDPRTLDAASTQALLEAVVALAVPEEDEALLDSPEAAATTLRLCRELGWTPAQVWATPAPEVDRLLRLLEAARGATVACSSPGPRTGPRPRGSRIADHPDAIVIQLEEDTP